MEGRALQRIALVAVLVVAVVAVLVELRSTGGSSSPAPTEQRSRTGTVAVGDLPAEARRTIARIQRGGPFPEPGDGTVFQNREGRLPAEPAGFYHEYTVGTPGSNDRGARRIVAGSNGMLYWTTDHYATFRQIVGATGSKGS